MRLRADFEQPATVRATDHTWVPSPSGGVERMMLDRIGDEVARATSLVRFAPGSAFSAHTHGGGEEYLVLDGVFTDDEGDHPTGRYVRNPIGTSHTPSTAPGCTIFVKLHQFDAADTTPVEVDIFNDPYVAGPADGITQQPLHRFKSEEVRMFRFAPGAALPPMALLGGAEILVIEGSLEEGDSNYGARDWLRRPAGSTLSLASLNGALAWIKTGHLAA